jgi:hypothetical protein
MLLSSLLFERWNPYTVFCSSCWNVKSVCLACDNARGFFVEGPYLWRTDWIMEWILHVPSDAALKIITSVFQWALSFSLVFGAYLISQLLWKLVQGIEDSNDNLYLPLTSWELVWGIEDNWTCSLLTTVLARSCCLWCLCFLCWLHM